MSKRKTLREKLEKITRNTDQTYEEGMSLILRLIREDRRKHCAECQRVKLAIEKQIAKNDESKT